MIITCPECGKRISDNAQICPGCGMPMQEIKNRLSEHTFPVKRVCSLCGHIITESMEECPVCGHPANLGRIETFEHIKCIKCKAEYSPLASVCSKCGSPKFTLTNDSTKLNTLVRQAKFTCSKVGDIIEFGRYEQGNGIEPIEWQVLDKKDNKILVISQYALDCKEYNEKEVNITWEKCTLRGWLNNEFISKAFNSEEQAAIATTVCTAVKNSKYNVKPGNPTKDKIFLLNINETEKYFKSDRERMCVPTEYAISNGVSTNNKHTQCAWWLRSPGEDQSGAAAVSGDGWIGYDGCIVDGYGLAVRPALWINL